MKVLSFDFFLFPKHIKTLPENTKTLQLARHHPQKHQNTTPNHPLGVFASIWQQRNNRASKYNSWIVCDGPIDAIWIENLNTVLDDNKILTLANNDRIPMTDNCRIVFEVESLRNASPATVSRAGIIYVSTSDLGWGPLVESWLLQRMDLGATRHQEVTVLRKAFDNWLGKPPPDAGVAVDFFDWIARNLKGVMETNETILISNILNLLSAMLRMHVQVNEAISEAACIRVFAYSVAWGMGGLLEPDGRKAFHAKLCEVMEQAGWEFLADVESRIDNFLYIYSYNTIIIHIMHIMLVVSPASNKTSFGFLQHASVSNSGTFKF